MGTLKELKVQGQLEALCLSVFTHTPVGQMSVTIAVLDLHPFTVSDGGVTCVPVPR